MKSINLPAGTTHVPFNDLDRLIAIAETPNESSLSERMEHAWALASPLLKAVRDGKLRVRSPRPGNEPYPPDVRSALLLCSVVDVLDLQSFAGKYRETAVRVGEVAPTSLAEQERTEREQQHAVETAKLSELARQSVIDVAEEERRKRVAVVPPAPTVADTQPQVGNDAPVVGALETKEQREDRRLRACIDAGLSMNAKAALIRLPDGVGDVARSEGVTRQAFSTDVKAALKRREAITKLGRVVLRTCT